jgi:hypothetical protein
LGGKRPTPLLGFLLLGVHGFGTGCGVEVQVQHFAGFVCMHQSVH